MTAQVRLVEVTDAARDAVITLRVHPAVIPWFRRWNVAPRPGIRGYGLVPTGEVDEDGEIVLKLDPGW